MNRMVKASEKQRSTEEDHICLCGYVLSMEADGDPASLPAEVSGIKP